jgi:hypothetical protein
LVFVQAAARFAHQFVAEFIKAIPGKLVDWTFQAIQAFGRWYWQLGMFAKVIVTAALGVVAIMVIGHLPLPSSLQDELTQLAKGVVVVACLLGLFVGMIRAR